MPKRTTDRQKAIYLLRKAIAPEGWSVEESAELYDPVLSVTREVDVVMRGAVNELDVLIGFEVNERSRAADVAWIESMLAKHEHLPTDKVILVSWQGFSKTARAKAASRPDVVLMSPKPVRHGEPRTLILYADEITFTLENVLFDVETPRGPVKVRVDPDHELRDDGGRTVAAFDYLLATFELHEVSHDMLVMAHNSESRESFRFFEIGWVIGFDSRLHLFDETRQERHRVTAVRVTGPFSWSQTPVDLRIESFTDVVFAHGKIALSGRDGHLVLTLQDGELRGPGALELRPSRPDQNIDGR